MAQQNPKDEKPDFPALSLGVLWAAVPLVAKLMMVGLLFISGVVVYDSVLMLGQPERLVPGEDLYIHITLLILVPGALLGLLLIAFGYAYYTWCKRWKQKPFWENM